MKYPFCCLPGFLKESKKQSTCRPSSGLPEGICRQFSLAEIKAASNNFDRESILGKDCFGSVYKGAIDDGSRMVAIKLHDPSVLIQGVKEFQNEVKLLCQLRHPHIISLIGFCNEHNTMIVVIEYMSKGSLADHIYGKNSHVPISWKQRLQICIGAASGLHYLHTGVKYAVIHRDLNTNSILLDDEWCCKLSDFGWSRMGTFSMSKVSVKLELPVVGAGGFVAPEYIQTGEVTEKSDVFSFGVVLFEVLFGRRVFDSSLPKNQQNLFGRRVFDSSLPKNQQNLLEWAGESLGEGTIQHVMDPYLQGRIAPECLEKYLEIACICVHDDANERPAMGEVEDTLELVLELQIKSDSEMEVINPHAW